MPKGTNQKLKLLYLMQLLEQESDEAHPLTVNQLIQALAQRDVTAERKSIYDDIEALSQYGLDIVTVRAGKGNAYYLGQRPFQTPELKLLIDAVQSARFISERKSRALIKKICALASRHEGGLMQRQVHVQGRAKTESERTYYSVDTIQTAITADSQLSFKYYEWAVDPKSARLFTRRWRHSGQPYTVSPWTLLWDNEYYYLVAYDSAAAIIKHYRVDKMTDLALTDTKREGREVFAQIDMAAYTNRVFGMFGGQEADVKLRFANHLIGVVVDRFGTGITILRDGEHHFTLTVKIVVSPQFMSWVFGFGDEVQLLAPQAVADQYLATIHAVRALYKPSG